MGDWVDSSTIDSPRPELLQRLVLGTAQLGLEYGIANSTGKPDRGQAHDLLDRAYELGIRRFDTAAVYGDSEEILGAWIAGKDAASISVVTKLGPADLDGPEKARSGLDRSLGRLGIETLDGLLLHDGSGLNSGAWVRDWLGSVREEGLARRIGLSFYDPGELPNYQDAGVLTLFQGPCNLFDRRVLADEVRSFFSVGEREIVVRSVYLQGLFFLDPATAARRVPGSETPLMRLLEFSRNEGVPLDVLALALPLSRSWIGGLAIGAEHPDQIERTVAAAHLAMNVDSELVAALLRCLGEVPAAVRDPRDWGFADQRK